MSRRRWVKATWPIDMRELGRRMQQCVFSGDAASGFIVDRIRENYVEGRFIEQINSHERLVDPIGRELHSDRIEFYQTYFVASTSNPGLEIIDGSKGIRFFINQISGICDDGISLSSLLVDPFKWGQELQKHLDVELTADSIQIGDLPITGGVKAKIVLTGTTDVREAARKVIDGRYHRIEKIRLSSANKPKIGVVLSSNGTATTFGKSNESLVVPVRHALSSVLIAGPNE